MRRVGEVAKGEMEEGLMKLIYSAHPCIWVHAEAASIHMIGYYISQSQGWIWSVALRCHRIHIQTDRWSYKVGFITPTLFRMVKASGSRIKMLALSVPNTRQEIASSSAWLFFSVEKQVTTVCKYKSKAGNIVTYSSFHFPNFKNDSEMYEKDTEDTEIYLYSFFITFFRLKYQTTAGKIWLGSISLVKLQSN